MEELFEKRTKLILDYISQILVYGSDTTGVLNLEKHDFDDGKYIILTVSVVKNSYFRWHDLGIKNADSKKFYDYLFKKIMEKFNTFSLSIDGSSLIISSSVNHNIMKVNFLLDKKTEKDWFDKVKNQI